ncbi:MAG TPA: hypothetical protein VGM27_19550 [Acidobacteriaceae bacterium]
MSKSNGGIWRMFAGVVLLTAGTIALDAASPAQSSPGLPANFVGHGTGDGSWGFGHARFAKLVTGEPYTATAISTSEQTLADGTHITHHITATIARDSAGRTVRSRTSTGSQNSATVVSIFDPVANQRIEYNTATKKAHIFVLPAKSDASDAMAESNSGATRSARGSHFHSPDVSITRDSLGTQTVAGVSAQGTRTTRTIAVGAFGNDKPLVSTDETWYSPDLQILLASTRNDPRFGQTTYSISNLQRAEPNASLFQVPAGYETETVNLPQRSAMQ